MYKLDVAALLQMLQEFQQNATLQTEIQSVPAGRGRFYVHLSIFEGKVASCSIKDGDGQVLLANNNALQWLQRLGTLHWTLTLQQTSTPTPVQTKPSLPQVPAPRVFVPRRIAPIAHEQMSTWPRKHRTIFVLIDGKKSVEQLASLLSLQVKDVEQVLSDLQARKFIAIE